MTDFSNAIDIFLVIGGIYASMNLSSFWYNLNDLFNLGIDVSSLKATADEKKINIELDEKKDFLKDPLITKLNTFHSITFIAIAIFLVARPSLSFFIFLYLIVTQFFAKRVLILFDKKEKDALLKNLPKWLKKKKEGANAASHSDSNDKKLLQIEKNQIIKKMVFFILLSLVVVFLIDTVLGEFLSYINFFSDEFYEVTLRILYLITILSIISITLKNLKVSLSSLEEVKPPETNDAEGEIFATS